MLGRHRERPASPVLRGAGLKAHSPYVDPPYPKLDGVHLMLRKLSLGYAAIVGAISVWTWVFYLANRGSEQQHLLPVIALALWSLPASVPAVNALCTEANGYCGEYGQLALITGCGAAQAVILVFAAYWLEVVRARKRQGGPTERLAFRAVVGNIVATPCPARKQPVCVGNHRPQGPAIAVTAGRANAAGDRIGDGPSLRARRAAREEPTRISLTCSELDTPSKTV